MNNKPANISVLLIIGLLFALLFFLLAVFGTNFGNRFGTLYQRKLDQATAAKERQAANRPEQKGSQAALVVDPDPVKSAGTVYKITGSGFKPGTVVFLNFSDPQCCLAFAVSPDDLGNISFRRETGKVGIYRVEAFQRIEDQLVLKAAVFFEVTVY